MYPTSYFTIFAPSWNKNHRTNWIIPASKFAEFHPDWKTSNWTSSVFVLSQFYSCTRIRRTPRSVAVDDDILTKHSGISRSRNLLSRLTSLRSPTTTSFLSFIMISCRFFLQFVQLLMFCHKGCVRFQLGLFEMSNRFGKWNHGMQCRGSLCGTKQTHTGVCRLFFFSQSFLIPICILCSRPNKRTEVPSRLLAVAKK